MQVIENYPNIASAYILMERCNGGINRNRTVEDAYREVDEIVGADGVDHATLVLINAWLGSLTNEEIDEFVDGEHEEQLEWLATQPAVAELAEGLFNDLFEKEVL